MKSVRVFYKKTGRMKFVSHLDMNRFMSRIIRRAGLDIWYTEGFNPHPYINFCIPLSLGFESEYEAMDIRINNDEMSEEEIFSSLCGVCPKYIKIIRVAPPVMKMGKVAFAKYRVCFDADDLKDKLVDFLSSKEIFVEKTSKSGEVKLINAAEHLKKFSVDGKDNCTECELVLPVGNMTVNPNLIIRKFLDSISRPDLCFTVSRVMLYSEDMKYFE